MFCVTAPLLPFDEISLLAGKRFVALFCSRSRARYQQFKQSKYIMMIGKSCEGSNEDFRNDSGTAVASIKPGPRPGWIALSSPSPCEAPAWTGESGGDFPLSPPGVVVIRGKDTTWRNENRTGTYPMESTHSISMEGSAFMAITVLLRFMLLVCGVLVAAPVQVMV